MTYKPAEKLLYELGIEEPGDIDIDAIAAYLNAPIEYEPLSGAEGRIIGYADRAIITVNSTSPKARQRFSAAHEIGHWMRDRGTNFTCSLGDMTSKWSLNDPEYRANRYAADLLMPKAMFQKYAKNLPITLSTVRKLATSFETSLTATAIRLIEQGSFPSMVLMTEGNVVKWGLRNKLVPYDLQYVKLLDKSSNTYRILSGAIKDVDSRDVSADMWIDHSNASDYTIKESAFACGEDKVLSLLWWEDEGQIVDLDED